MKYNKPEVKALASAIKAIQGLPKDSTPQVDSSQRILTVSAYEADE